MSRRLPVFLVPALLLAESLICGATEEPAPVAFECRVDEPGVACFGGAAWRRVEDDECSVLFGDQGYLVRTLESRNPISSGGIRSQNEYRAGLVRLDAKGEVLWARVLDYSASGVTMFQVLPVDSGGVLITLPFEAKGARTFVAFVDDKGELKWARVFDRPNVTLLPIIEREGRPRPAMLLASAMEVRGAPVPGIRSLVMALDPETGDILQQAVLPKRFNMAAFCLRDWDGALLVSMMGVDMMTRKFHAGLAKLSGSLEPLAGLSIVNAEAIFPMPQPLDGDRNLISYSSALQLAPLKLVVEKQYV